MKIGIIGDMHVGSIYGLAPREKAKSVLHKWLIDCWDTVIEEFNNEEIDKLVLIGDNVDGYGSKDSTTLWETDVDNQVDYSVQLLQGLILNRKVEILGCGGSGYHKGKGTGFDGDKQVTKRLNGKYHQDILYIETPYGNIAFRHTSKNPNTEMTNICQRTQAGLFKIDVLVGGHLHRFMDYTKAYVRIIHTPCWQYPTNFMGGIWEPVSIGGLILDIGKSGISSIPILFPIPKDVEFSMSQYNSISEEEFAEREKKEIENISKMVKVSKNVVEKVRREILKPKQTSYIPKKERVLLKPK